MTPLQQQWKIEDLERKVKRLEDRGPGCAIFVLALWVGLLLALHLKEIAEFVRALIGGG